MYHKFIEACQSGNLEKVQNLYSETQEDKRPKMFAAKNYCAFRLAARKGYLEVIKFLCESCSEDERSKMLAADDYSVFQFAAKKGYLEVVKFLWNICSENDRPAMLAANDYGAFQLSADNGYLDVIKFLCESCSEDERSKMLAADDYSAFQLSADNGYLDVIEFLLSVSDEPTRKEIFSLYENLTCYTQLICQRREIKQKFPEFNIDDFNFQLTLLTKNSRFAKLLLTCKNLPEALGNSIVAPELLAETANFVCGKNIFNMNITDALKAAQLIVGSGLSTDSPEFFLKVRENHFGLC